MPIDIASTVKEFANVSARSDFEFAKYDRLQLQYQTPSAPGKKRLKLFSWPPAGGELGKRVRMHYNLGGNKKAAVVCPKQHDPEASCPICEIVAELSQTGTEIQRKAIANFVAKDRFFILCLDVDELEKSQGAIKKVYVWNVASGAFLQILSMMQEEWGDFTALPESYMLAVDAFRDGAGPGKAVCRGCPQKIQVSLDTYKECFPDLAKIVAAPPAQAIESMFFKSPLAPQGITRTKALGAGQVMHAAQAAPAPGFSLAGQQPPAPGFSLSGEQPPAAPAPAGFMLSPPAAAPAPASFALPPAPAAPAAPVAQAAPPMQTLELPLQPANSTPTTTIQPAAAKPKRSLQELLGTKKP